MRDINKRREALRFLYVKSQRLLDQLLAPYGASVARLVMLSYIAENKTVRSANIIRDFALAPRTVTEAIDALQDDGLIERKADPSDRRAKLISLTKDGDKLLRTLEPLRSDFGEQLFSALSPKEETTLVGLIEKLNARLREIEAALVGANELSSKPERMHNRR